MQNKNYVQLTYNVVNEKQSYDYMKMKKDIELLQEIYPFMKVESIGKSVNGRDISHIKIGEGERKIHLNASFHGNEWLTSFILMSFINEICLMICNEQSFNQINPGKLFKQVTLSFVPMVNPDGVNIVLNGPDKSDKKRISKMNSQKYDFTWWKANANGVDLNNQFPANWEIEKKRKYEKFPAPRDYPGDYPLSEPESIAMANLVKNEEFDMIIALHSQGKEIYWGYEGYEPDNSLELVKKMEYVSGYKAVKYIDSHAGFRDWFIKEFRKPGFTIEVGKGINPLPISSFEQNYKDVKKILLSTLK